MFGKLRFDPPLEEQYRRQRQARARPLFSVSLAVGAGVNLLFGFWDLHLDPGSAVRTVPLRLALSAFMGVLWLVSRSPFGRLHLTLLTHSTLIVVLGGVSLVHALLPDGFSYGVAGLLLLMIFGTVLATDARVYLPASVIYVVVPNALLLLSGASPFVVINTNWFLVSGACSFLALAWLLDVANRRAFRLEVALSEEQRRSESLLRSLLPSSVAERLKHDEARIADAVEAATVLFADIVGFTRLARRMPPARLVELLDTIFTRLDAAADRHGVEKIKTVGDAYMAAVGVADASGRGARDMAEFALEALTVVEQVAADYRLPLRLRIGMSVGPVVSGVIGDRKPHFDLWGDTVNTASRLESNGLPGQIQVDERTYQCLREQYAFASRGTIRCKGLGSLRAYLLKGRQGSAAASALPGLAYPADPAPLDRGALRGDARITLGDR